MKKIITIILLLCISMSYSVVLSSCSPEIENPDHTHDFSQEWSSDATHHWHDCKDDTCSETAEKDEHSFEENICSICNYRNIENSDSPNETTDADPYADFVSISTAEELRAIQKDGKYRLVNDIDLEGIEWTPLFLIKSTGVGEIFNGVFDGCGYTISNYKISNNATANNRYVNGLFGCCSGTIKNLTVKNVVLETFCSGQSGALVGKINAGGKIINCSVVDLVTNGRSKYAGGIVGFCDGGTVINSCVKGEISATNNQGLQHAHFSVGGVVGHANDATIVNCYAIATLKTLNYYRNCDMYDSYAVCGGLIGSVNKNCSIYNCYFDGQIIAENSSNSSTISTLLHANKSYAGGIVGSVAKDSKLTIENCYSKGKVSSSVEKIFISNGPGKANAHSYAGGIIGVNTGNVSMNNCYALADVYAFSKLEYTYQWDGDIASYGYAGGLIGNGGVASIKNSYAFGLIECISNAVATPSTTTVCMNDNFVGYLVGETTNATQFDDCWYSYNQVIKSSVDGGETYENSANCNTTGISIYYVDCTTMDSNLKNISWISDNLWTTESEIWTFSGEHPELNYNYINNTEINIENKNQLQSLQNKTLVLSYSLKDDIDLGNNVWIPVRVFAGKLNGNGFSISNIKITSTNDYVGFISSNYGDITKLSLINMSIEANHGNLDNGSIGLLIGFNAGSVENTKASGNINVVGTYIENDYYVEKTEEGIYIGGLFGYSVSGRIWGCESTSNIIAKNIASVGGLAGLANNTEFDASSSSGTISAQNSMYAGGLIGRSASNVNRCYSTSNLEISDSTNVGGLIGYVNSGTVLNCYYSGDINGKNTENVGSLIGNLSSGNIEQCYSVGSLYRTDFDSENDELVQKDIFIGNISYGDLKNCFGRINEKVIIYKYKHDFDIVEIDSIDFYTNTLGWSSEIWIFDINQYPVLRCINKK